jgi:hypothetical protein
MSTRNYGEGSFYRLSFILLLTIPARAGVPNLGDASPRGDLRGLKPVIIWLLLYQWGDAIGLRGDAETKRLGTPVLG